MRDQFEKSSAQRDRSSYASRSADVMAIAGRNDLDVELMVRVVRNSDRTAFSRIGEHYAPRLKTWLISRGEQSTTSEDIVQDVLIQVWTKAGQFDSSKGSFSAWVFRMTRNRWLDHRRKHDRQQPTEPRVMADLADSPVEAADAELEQSQRAEAVHGELAKLPLEQKQILHLAFFEGLSHGEIAERTGLALGTVKSRIRLPLKKMQSRLRELSGVKQ